MGPPIRYFHESGFRRKKCALIGIDTSTRWVLFLALPFPFSDFRAVVNARVRIGRSGLLRQDIPKASGTIRENRGNQTSVGIGFAAVGLGFSKW